MFPNKIPLATARKITVLTQKELAAAMGVTASTVLHWEKGRTEPTINQAKRLSCLLGLPLDAIIFLPSNTVKP